MLKRRARAKEDSWGRIRNLTEELASHQLSCASPRRKVAKEGQRTRRGRRHMLSNNGLVSDALGAPAGLLLVRVVL